VWRTLYQMSNGPTLPRLAVAVAAMVVIGVAPATALATTGSAGDASATRAYIAANYTLVRTARSYLRRAEAAPLSVLAQVRRECPRGAAGSPQDPESTELSDEVIGAMVVAAYHLDVGALRSFAARVEHLHWSSARLTRTVRSYGAEVAVLAGLAPPKLCADLATWGASDFKTLPPATVHFDAIFMPAWVKLGEVPPALKAYENSEERGIAARASILEGELVEGEARAVESWGKIMNELELEP
jgi:hypothetical protein